MNSPASNEVTVGFQGEPGAYSEAAARELFGVEIKTLPFDSFDEVYEAVEGQQALYALLPIENSSAGSIHRNYDLMLRHSLTIQREYHFRVSHCLLAIRGATLEDVRWAHSHPQALAQCENSLVKLGVKPVVELDTAGSARLIKERDEKSAAAIASKWAGEVYGLEALVENLEDYPENYTRFLALNNDELPSEPPQDGDYKTSIVFSLPNVPGSLYKAMSAFALRDIDLTKIESRPFQGRPLEYLFYIDFAGHAGDLACQRALAHLAEMAPMLRVLGSYPRHRLVVESPPVQDPTDS